MLLLMINEQWLHHLCKAMEILLGFGMISWQYLLEINLILSIIRHALTSIIQTVHVIQKNCDYNNDYISL